MRATRRISGKVLERGELINHCDALVPFFHLACVFRHPFGRNAFDTRSNSSSSSLFSNRRLIRPRTCFGPLGRGPIRVSGSGSCTIVGPEAVVGLNCGCKTSGLGFWQAEAKIGVYTSSFFLPSCLLSFFITIIATTGAIICLQVLLIWLVFDDILTVLMILFLL
jgi:hypothetical protein